jgi:C1A family cysteine protease
MINTGYLIDKEDRGFIDSLESEEQVLQLMGTYEETSLDPRQLIRVENQGRMSSCAGHSLSSVLEWIYCISSGGKTIQLSRMQAYVMAQEFDRIRSDSGSTISSGIKLATTFGLAEENLWPYPSRYTNKRPSNWDAIKENSAKHKVVKQIRITTYEGFRTFLGAGLGGIHTGISWGSSMNKAVVETFSGGGGGHSVCGLCLSNRFDRNGEPYMFIANSWSTSFGNKGWQEWSPTAIRQMLKHRFTVFVGVSDMPNVQPRKFTEEEWTKKFLEAMT